MTKKATMYRFEQSAGTHRLYVYDNVTAYGNFNWNTLEYDESETSCKYFRDQLADIPEDGEIELHVNSCGGSVMEGIAIYNLLKQHKAHKTCYVDGFAYSIASVICLACDKIIMGVGSSMMIHNMAMSVYGNANDLRKCADDLDTLMEGNRKIYMERAKNLTEDQLIEMMNAETFLTPEQCLEYGFCDEIGTTPADDRQDQNFNQYAMEQIRQLKQQIAETQSFRQEMKTFMQHGVPDPKPEPEKKGKEPEQTGEDKALKLMRAFFNAFD